MNNKEYARVLSEISLLKQLKGENVFKVRAYENAARAVENLTQPVEDILASGELTGVSGIGKSIASEIEEIAQTGASSTHSALLAELDPGLLDIMAIQGLGPKRIKLLYDELGITNIELLQEAASSGRIAELDGMGAKTQEKVLQEIDRIAEAGGRTPLPAARAVAESIRAKLSAVEGVENTEVAGSIRRGRETIGDIDILIAARGTAPEVFQTFVDLPEIDEIIARGETKTSARLRSGIQVDVRVVAPHEFGAALYYFTGSKEHNVKMRARAKKLGYKINEYGVIRLSDGEVVASATEEDLFEALGLDYIPPEIRESGDEIELAEKGELPELLQNAAVRGDIHMHTVETDGRATIEEMAEAARALGHQYIVITDHSQAVTVANGMTPERFRAHIDRIREADLAVGDIRILSGIEVDILKEGELDMDEELLAECDWVVGSVHSHFNMESSEMTARLVRAIDTGLLSCLGHPTGRILGGRNGYSYDFDTVLEHAVEHGVAFEINGSTGRLDLNAGLAARAKAGGAKIVLGSDAHSVRGLEDLTYAIQQARRARLTAHDVLNTRSSEELLDSVRFARR